MPVKVIPVVVHALGTAPKKLKQQLSGTQPRYEAPGDLRVKLAKTQ